MYSFFYLYRYLKKKLNISNHSHQYGDYFIQKIIIEWCSLQLGVARCSCIVSNHKIQSSLHKKKNVLSSGNEFKSLYFLPNLKNCFFLFLAFTTSIRGNQPSITKILLIICLSIERMSTTWLTDVSSSSSVSLAPGWSPSGSSLLSLRCRSGGMQ